MGRRDKLLRRVLDGKSAASIRFRDLRSLLLRLGFEERIRGSHHLFQYPELGLFINLQSTGANAKPYQVKQVRIAIMKLQEGSSE